MRTIAHCVMTAIVAFLCSNGRAQSKPGSAQCHHQESSIIQVAIRNPRDLSRVTAAGEVCFHNKHWQQSAYWLSKAYKLSPRDRQIGYDLAFAEIQSGDLTGAERQLQEILAGGDAAKLHTLRGELLEIKGAHSDAAHEYYRAAELDPSEDSLFDLANFLLQHKKYSGYLAESVKFFRYGVSQFANSSRMRVGLGVALYASEEYDEAVKVLCEAVDLAPADPKPVTFLGMARRVSPEMAKQVDQRLKEFADRYPQSPAANYEYALSLWERNGGDEGKYLEEIEKLLVKATAEAPRWFEPHYQLGLLYESRGRSMDAIREMRRACLLEPSFKAAHFRLAVLYKRIGDRQHAMQEAAQARQLDNAEIDSTMLQSAAK